MGNQDVNRITDTVSLEEIRECEKIKKLADRVADKLSQLDKSDIPVVEAFADGYMKGFKAGVKASQKALSKILPDE